MTATYRRHRVGGDEELLPNRHLVGLCDGPKENLMFIASEVAQAAEDNQDIKALQELHNRKGFVMPKRLIAVEQKRTKGYLFCLLTGFGDIIYIFATLALAGSVTPGLWVTYLIIGLFPNLMFMVAAMLPLRWLQTCALCACSLYAIIVFVDTRGLLSLQIVFVLFEVFGLVRLRTLTEPTVYFL